MGQAIEELAHFIANTPWDAIPQSVREHAKLVVLDTVGVILAGSVQPEVAAVRARLTATGGLVRSRGCEKAHAATSRIPIEKRKSGRSFESWRAWCSALAPSLAWRSSSTGSMSCHASPISSSR